MQEEKTGLHGLSPREFEILRMILDAKSTDEIASALNLSRKTVANYHYVIRSKLGVDFDIELLYFGLRQGLTCRAQFSWRSIPGIGRKTRIRNHQI